MLDVLILGYGNTLRSDDALGVHAAHALHDFYCTDGGIRVLATSQLTGDLAEDISQAQLVIFIDAADAGVPGEMRSETLLPAHEKVRFTHHWTPGTLLMVSKQLYGRAPSAVGLTMAVASTEVGVGLSKEVQNRLPELLEHAKAIVSNWRLANVQGKPGSAACPEAAIVGR
jgi:hydrogenase maturation protease